MRSTFLRGMILGVLCALCLRAASADVGAAPSTYVYTGSWKTTNRKLDGTMTCIVKPIWNHQWQGRFYGVWQGVKFDYTANFHGPTNDLRGTATIDGASYEWRGRIDAERLRATFAGSRYEGVFDLQRVAPTTAADGKRSPRAIPATESRRQ